MNIRPRRDQRSPDVHPLAHVRGGDFKSLFFEGAGRLLGGIRLLGGFGMSVSACLTLRGECFRSSETLSGASLSGAIFYIG